MRLATISPMQRGEREQDRSQTNAYSAILKGKDPLKPVLRFGIILLGIPMVVWGPVWIVSAIADVIRAPGDDSKWLMLLVRATLSVGLFVLGSAMIMRVLGSASPARRRQHVKDHQHPKKF